MDSSEMTASSVEACSQSKAYYSNIPALFMLWHFLALHRFYHLPSYVIFATHHYIYTAILFTWTDYKTILLPVVSTIMVLTKKTPVSFSFLRRCSLVQQRPSIPFPTYSGGWCGYGFISSFATSQIKQGARQKMRSIVFDDLFYPEESQEHKLSHFVVLP